MEKLLRTRVERFMLEEAYTLSQIEKIRDEGQLEEILTPVDRLFSQYPLFQAVSEAEKRLENGNPLLCEELTEVKEPEHGPVRIYAADGRFSGIYQYDPKIHRYRPVKMFL